jgi:hypothetical protein
MSSKAWANLKSYRTDATIVFMLRRASSTWKTSTSTESLSRDTTSTGRNIVPTTLWSRSSKEGKKNVMFTGSIRGGMSQLRKEFRQGRARGKGGGIESHYFEEARSTKIRWQKLVDDIGLATILSIAALRE